MAGHPTKTIIACRTLTEEFDSFRTCGMRIEALASGLHLHADRLRGALQERIDKVTGLTETIVVGYGMCSMGVIGLKAGQSALVIPRADDCIGILLGTREAYKDALRKRPGTYFLSKGWIKAGITLVDDLQRMEARYGKHRAHLVMKRMLRHYRYLAFLDTGKPDEEGYRSFARKAAEMLGLTYGTIRGTRAILQKMVEGPWDGDFVVKAPGQQVTLNDFGMGNAGEVK